MTRSLDSVLADVDASEQEIANETPVVETEQAQPEPEQETDDPDQGRDAHGALHAERQRVKRKYTDTVADFEKRLSETNSGFEKKLTESLAENDRKWEQRFNQFAQTIQPRQTPEPETPAVRPDLYENSEGFVEYGVKQHVDPIKQEVSQLREFYSQREAVREHGQEKVQTAFNAMHQAAISGDRDAQAAVARVKQSIDPYGDIVAWHQRTSVLSEVGNDPAAYREKLRAELLAELNAGGQKPPAQQQQRPTPTALPSLNRVTAAADEDEEEEDAREVFNSSLRAGVRR